MKTRYTSVPIRKWRGEPYGRPDTFVVTKEWRNLLNIMYKHMKAGGAVDLYQNGDLVDVELLP